MMTVTIPLYVFIIVFYILPVVGNIILSSVLYISSIEFKKKYYKNIFIFTPVVSYILFIIYLYVLYNNVKESIQEKYIFYKRRKRDRIENERMKVYKISHGIIRYNSIDPYGEEEWEPYEN